MLGRQIGIEKVFFCYESLSKCYTYDSYSVSATKDDSIRRVIQHIDDRNWRILEYFRMLNKSNKQEIDSKAITLDIAVRKILFLCVGFMYNYLCELEIGCETGK